MGRLMEFIEDFTYKFSLSLLSDTKQLIGKFELANIDSCTVPIPVGLKKRRRLDVLTVNFLSPVKCDLDGEFGRIRYDKEKASPFTIYALTRNDEHVQLKPICIHVDSIDYSLDGCLIHDICALKIASCVSAIGVLHYRCADDLKAL